MLAVLTLPANTPDPSYGRPRSCHASRPRNARYRACHPARGTCAQWTLNVFQVKCNARRSLASHKRAALLFSRARTCGLQDTLVITSKQYTRLSTPLSCRIGASCRKALSQPPTNTIVSKGKDSVSVKPQRMSRRSTRTPSAACAPTSASCNPQSQTHAAGAG